MYCADNQISCTIIYALNIFGLLLVLGILFKSRESYLKEWKRIRQVIKDYSIDYRSAGNFPIFAKFLGVLIGFCILIIASIISIILWDSSFGLMEVSNVFLWTTCAFLFYIDYRSIFKFSKQLRLALAIILIIQFTSGLVFGIERNLEKENKGIDDLTVEASVYLCNFIIVLVINIISLFFPKFEYQKINKNSDDNNFISINNLSHHLISDDSFSLQTQKQNPQQNSSSQRQSISKNPKRNQSFIDQLDEFKKDDGSQNSLGSSSIQKLKQEQSGLIDLTYGLKKEEEAIQKEKEQKELMSQIFDMHKQLDEKLNKFKQDSEVNQQEQQQSPVKDKEQKNSNQELTELSNQLNTQKQPEANVNSKYEIQSIKIEGFEEIKKQGKRFIYFKIFYFSNSKQRQVRTEHNLKEFQQLRYALSQIYVNHSFPEIPEKKPNERLTGKDVASRGEALEKFLQFIVQHQMQCPTLDKFLEETSGPVLIEDEKETNIDQVLKDKSFDDFLEIRKASITSKQSYLDKDFNEDSLDPKSRLNSSSYDQTSYFSRNPDRYQSSIQPGMGNGHKFIIKEVKTLQQITYYKIEGSINNQTVATVQRRYNDFKELYKKLLERQYQIPVLPNEPIQKQQDVIAYRQEALAQFLNALYQNKSVKTNMVFKEFVGI
ncbi:unnamed protein product (macronuclear) [Paramecium tetraurelia]|uniref:PX domain-containing protein n=1 Tax=Paramecium tetraurelia TaxID=5888 RepID=A0DGG7_PARTE|nr:uncharacterized protein GSPATT00002263001 [Paramecium tetraurelia]CAK82134.1 unnamed protein product [Paramecium tetraurelia]|eukprot:XP_001449531.1 hypothetical protein (macronuclear) [Paramecium tetraurelia strain d4-2]